VTLTWNASSVPGGGTVTGYAIFENDHQIATTSATTYAATNLAADTTYAFAVAAIDAAGSSAESNPISVHTAPASPGGSDGGDSHVHEFSPYIDMAMPADANLSAISAASGIHNFTLAFVLSSPGGIGWQGAGTISDDTLSNGTTILSQVQAIQAAGGDVTISFGGAAGQEAALTATSAASLQAEYQSVIDRYHVHSLDFDIEGAAVQDQHSITLRDQALVGLKAANPDLVISFTLPVLPSGLTADGLNVLASAKHDGLKIDVVNIMAMDYGSSVDNGGQMGLDAINAAIATEKQIAGLGLSSKIGITPMIGVNDISSEVFTLADAQTLVHYAQTDPNVVRLSMWSVARDNGNSAGAHLARQQWNRPAPIRFLRDLPSVRSYRLTGLARSAAARTIGGRPSFGPSLSCFLTIPIYHTGYPLGGNTHSQTAARNLPLLRVFVGRDVITGDAT
jgi:hypothetical protein